MYVLSIREVYNIVKSFSNQETKKKKNMELENVLRLPDKGRQYVLSEEILRGAQGRKQLQVCSFGDTCMHI